MDKKNIYYVVVKGTNTRSTNEGRSPFMAEEAAADIKRIREDKTSSIIGVDEHKHEIISVADYEKKFTSEDDSE